MNFITNVINKFYKLNYNISDSEIILEAKIKLLISIMTLMSIALFSFAILRFLDNNLVGALFDFIAFIINVFLIYKVKHKKTWYTGISRYMLILSFIVIFFTLYIEHDLTRGVAWGFAVLVIAFSLRDRKEGAFWSLVLFIMGSVLYITEINVNMTEMKYISIVISMLAISSIMFFYEKIKMESKSRMVHLQDLKLFQSVIDVQDNMILITDGKCMTSANNSFLKFLNIQNPEEFNNRYKSICELFIEADNYFNPKILENKNQSWMQYVYLNKNKTYKVVMISLEDFEPKSFKININLIQERKIYVITFSDITNIEVEAREFEYKATHDNLTGIYNRQYFNDVLNKELSLNNKPLKINKLNKSYLVIMDIDKFKNINDTHGHLIGDETLKAVTRIVKNSIEKDILFARWGGEEFVLFIKDNTYEETQVLINTIRENIERFSFNQVKKVTSSFGITNCIEDESLDDIIKRADVALYEAKENGRNRLVFNTIYK
jgi:two-component system, cell cycle response regulator